MSNFNKNYLYKSIVYMRSAEVWKQMWKHRFFKNSAFSYFDYFQTRTNPRERMKTGNTPVVDDRSNNKLSLKALY